jgi:hypothetical protein
MSKVITTKKINIDQLGHESKVDLNIVSEPDGTFVIESSVTQKTLESFIDAHVADSSWVNPSPVKEVTIAEKLASVGLSIDDLKAALGL